MTQFETYVNAIRKCAHHYADIYNIDYDELEAQGYLIYCEALKSYDPSKSKFITHLMSELRGLGNYARSLYKHEKYGAYSLDTTPVEFESDALPSLDEILELGNSSLSKMAYEVFEWILKRSWEKVGRSKPTLTNVCDQFNLTKTVAERVWKEIRDFYRTEPIFVV